MVNANENKKYFRHNIMLCRTICKDRNIIALIEGTGQFFTTATQHKQRRYDDKNIDQWDALQVIQHNNYENVAGSVWLSLFMSGTEKCYTTHAP